jgi:outer membrane protein
VKNNNLSIVLNVVLLFAVAILFYLHFSSRKAIAEVKDTTDSTANLTFRIPKNLSGAKVLYINVDSINANYEAFADLYASEGGTLEQQYQQYQVRANNWQRRNAILQERASKGTISADSAQIEETWLVKEEKALVALEKYLNNLNNSAMEKSALINEEVFKYFSEYSKDKGIDYILAYGAGSPIVYANDSLDVTRDVVDALNANYRKNKGGNLIQAPK